jgi:DNA-binding transcriptional MerR regulator
MDRLRVSELASEVGTSPDALRYYERIGLLAPPERSAAGYRLYDLEAVERVRFIKRAQRFGLRLADIAGLIAVQERGLCPCGGTRRLLEARMAELDEEMAALLRLRQEIGAMLDQEQALAGARASQCGPLCGGEAQPGDPTAGVRTIVSIRPAANGKNQHDDHRHQQQDQQQHQQQGAS